MLLVLHRPLNDPSGEATRNILSSFLSRMSSSTEALRKIMADCCSFSEKHVTHRLIAFSQGRSSTAFPLTSPISCAPSTGAGLEAGTVSTPPSRKVSYKVTDPPYLPSLCSLFPRECRYLGWYLPIRGTLASSREDLDPDKLRLTAAMRFSFSILYHIPFSLSCASFPALSTSTQTSIPFFRQNTRAGSL